MHKRYLFLILLAGIASGCAGKKAESPVQVDTLVVNFYADSLVLSEEAKLSGMDSTTFASGIDSLYRTHGISRDSVNSSIQTYQKALTTWKRFYEMLVKRLEYLRTKE